MWHIVKKMALVVLLLYSAKGKAQSVAYSSVTATIVTDVNQLSLAERGFADISYGEMKFSNTGFSNVETSGQRYIITKPGKISVVAARLIVTGTLGYNFDLTVNNSLTLSQNLGSANIFAQLNSEKASRILTNVSGKQIIEINADLAIGNRPVTGVYTAKDFEICLNYY